MDRLKKARKSKGFTQLDMCKHLGVAKSTYSMYETRNNRMDIETFVQVCRILDVTPNEILGFGGDTDK